MMGDAADMVLEGYVCEECGCFIGDDESPGYPRKCDACEPIYTALKESNEYRKANIMRKHALRHWTKLKNEYQFVKRDFFRLFELGYQVGSQEYGHKKPKN